MKKRISMIMVICLLLSLTACGVNSGTNSNTEPSATQSQAETSPSEPAAEPTEEAAKMLVVYFSVTGNTKAVAEEITRLTGADLYEIVPAVPYTDEDLNYNNNECRANQEMNDASARLPLAVKPWMFPPTIPCLSAILSGGERCRGSSILSWTLMISPERQCFLSAHPAAAVLPSLYRISGVRSRMPMCGVACVQAVPTTAALKTGSRITEFLNKAMQYQNNRRISK